MIYEFNGSLVDGLYYFYASWNSKCNTSLDRLQRLDNNFKDINIVRCNISKYINIKNQFNINKIPSYVYIKDGKEVKRINGNTDYITISKMLMSL